MMDIFWKYRKLDNVRATDWTDGKKSMQSSMNLGAFGTAKCSEDVVSEPKIKKNKLTLH